MTLTDREEPRHVILQHTYSCHHSSCLWNQGSWAAAFLVLFHSEQLHISALQVCFSSLAVQPYNTLSSYHIGS